MYYLGTVQIDQTVHSNLIEVTMVELLYTTAELSAMMHVGISSIKRWTDEGKLRCIRTPGGHRKFRAADVHDFIAQFHYSVPVPKDVAEAVLDVRFRRDAELTANDIVRSSVEHAVRNEHRFIEKQLVARYAAGDSVASIFDSYLLPVLKEIEKGRSEKSVSTVEYQLAKNTLLHALIFFADTLPRTAAGMGELYCLTANERLNEIELKAVEILLEHTGYRVYNLGTVLTQNDVNDLVAQCKPEDVFVVVSLRFDSFEAGQQFHDLVRGVLGYGGSVCVSDMTGGSADSETEQGVQFTRIRTFGHAQRHFQSLPVLHTNHQR